MLIVNDDHLMRAGVCSLDELCPYCGFAFHDYPLIMSDDPRQTVYHAACALELATDLLVDLYTFFRPPAPYQQLFTCDFSRTLAASAKLCDFAPSRPNLTYSVWRLGPEAQFDPFIC